MTPETDKERDEARARVELIKPHKNNPVAEYFSSSNTPETDSATKYWLCEKMELVDSAFARRLERERNEAKHDFEEQSEVVRNLKVALMEVSKLTRTLKQERDEALEVLREITAADWRTSGELRGMARKALEAAK